MCSWPLNQLCWVVPRWLIWCDAILKTNENQTIKAVMANKKSVSKVLVNWKLTSSLSFVCLTFDRNVILSFYSGFSEVSEVVVGIPSGRCRIIKQLLLLLSLWHGAQKAISLKPSLYAPHSLLHGELATMAGLRLKYLFSNLMFVKHRFIISYI